jgi:hypothetical protein
MVFEKIKRQGAFIPQRPTFIIERRAFIVLARFNATWKFLRI